jgi:hypothetical protein
VKSFIVLLVASALLPALEGCGDSQAPQANPVVSAPPVPTWRFGPRDSTGVASRYRFTPSEFFYDLGLLTEQQAFVVFDNGASSSLQVLLPEDNQLDVPPSGVAVLETVGGRHEWQIRRTDVNGLETNAPLTVNLDGNGATYVYNADGLRSYVIERKTYAITNSPIFGLDDVRYEVRGETWFQVRYGKVDFFFEPFPAHVTTSVYSASSQRVRLSW